MCVRLGFIKPGYAEVYCAHCGYCIGYVHREEVIVSTNLDTGRQTTVNRWFPETNDGDAWSMAHGGGFADRTDPLESHDGNGSRPAGPLAVRL